ncbi:MAG: class I SAM-dependent methyltransferase [bacterium]
MPIENVSDTALWVAVYRAMETARPDALFKDPYAERLAGERGHEIMLNMKDGKRMAWAMIVRTQVFDEIIMERIKGGGVDTVLNLAAGLDTRAWRLPLPSSLKWIDVDLPAMSEYKSSRMKGETPVCQYEAIAADLTNDAVRDALLSQIGASSQRMLVITEGLLVYLAEAEVVSLANAIHATKSARWWLSDIASPMLLQYMSRNWGKAVEKGNAPFKFGPPDSAAFFAPLGWKEIVFRPTVIDARRLKRQMSGMWVWGILSLFMSPKRRAASVKMSAIIVLERVD